MRVRHDADGRGGEVAVTDSDAVATLRRWELFGGRWQVLARSESVVTVGLFTCDGGQEMSRLTTTSSDFDAFVAGPRPATNGQR
jgi:hypothetical protein